MPKEIKAKTYNLYVFHLPILMLLVALFVGTTYLSYSKASTSEELSNVLGKSDNKGSEKSSQAKANKTEKVSNVNSSKEEKSNSGSENAQLHRKNVEEVVTNLEEVADVEEVVGNEEVSAEIDEVATEEEEVVDEVAAAIEAVETRSKWQTLLIGTDYKNLGKLRSALAHNTNAIRKLTKTSGEVVGDGSDTTIDAQLALLMEERARIAGVIQTAEEEFSLLGWVVKFLTGYEDGGIEDEVDESTESDEVDETTETTEPAL